jgi:peptide/nickel transport system permease protein
MVTYMLRRLIQSVIIVILVTLIVFIVMRLMPGDPVLMYLSSEQYNTLSQEQIEFTRHELGLDKPMFLQYTDWVGGLLHGNLGTSMYYNKTVTKTLSSRLPVTLYLGLIAFVFGNIVGILAGVISAVRRGKALDSLVTLLANIGITVPTFWLAILLIYFFGLKLNWLPIYGFTSPFDDFWLSLRQIILPVFCLSIFSIGALARQTRSSMLEVVRQDYIRTAWSKGLGERVVILRHALKNGLIPIVTLSGMQIGGILGGSVIIETVFNISGMGRLAVDSLFSLDYPVVQAIVLISAIMIVTANLVVDISYGWLDPRIRYS